MAELYGKQQVADFINRADKKRWKVTVNGKSVRGVSNDDPVTDFEAWADMFDNQGQNTQCYTISCYDIEEDPHTGKAKVGGYRHTVDATFCLNMPQQRMPYGQQQATPVLSEYEKIAAIINGTKREPQVDIAAIVAAAVEKVAHQAQLKEITYGFQEIVKNQAMQLSDLREDLARMMEEEEEEEENNAVLKAAEIHAKGEAEKTQMIIGAVKDNAPMLRDLVLHFFPGSGSTQPALRAANAVNGPRINANNAQAKGFQIPVSDKPGELPLYLPQDKVNADDQKLKALNAFEYMFTEINDCAGDDLMLLKKLAIDDPNQYADLIQKLRNLMGVKPQ